MIGRIMKRLIPKAYKEIHCTINIVNQNNLLKNRCALITGGTSGIGLSIAEAFLKSGADVIITGRDEYKLNTTINKLSKISSDSIVCGYVLDSLKPETFDAIFNEILNDLHSLGRSKVDILVNNSGVNGPKMPYATIEEYDIIMNTNLRGTYFMSQMVGLYFIRNKIKGNILNIASASSLRPADSPYTLSKWGIRGLTMGLAKSLGNYGITVNGIAPGPTATPMMRNDSKGNVALGRTMFGRYILPEEIANMAIVLTSDVGRSIMGDVIYMTGGAGNLTFDDVKYHF